MTDFSNYTYYVLFLRGTSKCKIRLHISKCKHIKIDSARKNNFSIPEIGVLEFTLMHDEIRPDFSGLIVSGFTVKIVFGLRLNLQGSPINPMILLNPF